MTLVGEGLAAPTSYSSSSKPPVSISGTFGVR